MRVLTILGTRPEIIKLLPVMLALRERDGVTPVLCHTGQHRDMGRELLAMADIDIDHGHVRASTGLDALFAEMLQSASAAIAVTRPDIAVVQGDTASAAAGALAAFHAQVPVAHVEAGLRSGDLARPWPEEGYRRMIAQTASHHFAPTPAAAARLRAEAVAPHTVHMTGNTVIDALHWASRRLDEDAALAAEAGPLLEDRTRPFALVTVHRREHDAGELAKIAGSLREIADGPLDLVVPVHPRPESIDLIEGLADHRAIAMVPPLAYLPFVAMLRAARVIITDSGGIQEEASALGRPTVVLRSETERDEAVSAGTAQLVGSDPAAIVAATRLALDRPLPEPSTVFGDGQAARRIVDLLLA